MKYFKTKKAYYMVSKELTVKVVSVINTQFNLIMVIPKDHYPIIIGEKTPISETEFKNEFLRVSLLIEETINN